MHLNHLSLTNFRNFTRLDIDVPNGPVLVVGANGQGKTSLLEAIYYLATFTSFHAFHDRELVNFLAAREALAVGRIVAQFEREAEQHRFEIRIIKETNGINGSSRMRKEILLDGMKMKMGEAIGQFMAVLFLPQMVEVIEGAPEERRRFLNLGMSQVMPGFGRTLADYSQTLSQRNALLKQLQEFGGDAHQLDYWDELLVSKRIGVDLWQNPYSSRFGARRGSQPPRINKRGSDPAFILPTGIRSLTPNSWSIFTAD